MSLLELKLGTNFIKDLIKLHLDSSTQQVAKKVSVAGAILVIINKLNSEGINHKVSLLQDGNKYT